MNMRVLIGSLVFAGFSVSGFAKLPPAPPPDPVAVAPAPASAVPVVKGAAAVPDAKAVKK